MAPPRNRAFRATLVSPVDSLHSEAPFSTLDFDARFGDGSEQIASFANERRTRAEE